MYRAGTNRVPNGTAARSLRTFIVVVLYLAIGMLYWHGAMEQLLYVNTDMRSTDQGAYMNYARRMHDSGYTVMGNRNRMPVYPFLQSLFYSTDMDTKTFFMNGKTINLALSLFLLACLAMIFNHFFDRLHAFNLLLIVAFSVFIFKAGWFQAELLFYFLNFCLFLLFWRLLKKTSWQLAVLTGIVAGLAHLTKASILPGLIIFLVSAGAKWGWIAIRKRKYSSDDVVSREFSHFETYYPLFAIVIVASCFLITVFPYINDSKRVFGHYFYNVNSTFYIWYDSWDQAKHGTRAHGDRIGWPNMPADKVPSMSKYFREHSLREATRRLVEGAREVMKGVVHSYGYFKYCVIYLSFLVLVMASYRQKICRGFSENIFLYFFLASYFGCYCLLYFWYAPIVSGNRLILSLFVPLMFTISYGLQALLRSSEVEIGGRCVGTLTVFNSAILLLVLVDIYEVLTQRVTTLVGGH